MTTQWDENIFDPFGREMIDTETEGSALHYKYATHDMRNENTGLTYMQARWMDNDTGRFISPDPARQGTNWYVYCSNNPTTLIDPDGTTTFNPFMFYYGYNNYYMNYYYNSWDWSKFWKGAGEGAYKHIPFVDWYEDYKKFDNFFGDNLDSGDKLNLVAAKKYIYDPLAFGYNYYSGIYKEYNEIKEVGTGWWAFDKGMDLFWKGVNYVRKYFENPEYETGKFVADSTLTTVETGITFFLPELAAKYANIGKFSKVEGVTTEIFGNEARLMATVDDIALGKKIPLSNIRKPIFADNDLLVKASNGNLNAMKEIQSGTTYITPAQYEEFMAVKTKEQQVNRTIFLHKNNIFIYDLNKMTSTQEYLKVYNSVIKAGHSEGDAVLAAYAKITGFDAVTMERRLSQFAEFTMPQLKIPIRRIKN